MEKSSRAERARQFMPFSALRGFEELIRQQERTPTLRRELSEEEAEVLSAKLSAVERGDMVRVVYYAADSYVAKEGIVSEIDFSMRFLRIIKTNICFDDISEIERDQSGSDIKATPHNSRLTP